MTDTLNGIRLFTPTPKVALRLERQTFAAYAEEHELGYLDVESKFQSIRLRLHQSLRQLAREDALDQAVKGIVSITRGVIRSPVIADAVPVELTRELEGLTELLERVWTTEKLRSVTMISLDEAEMFIAIADEFRKKYLAEQYDPVDVVVAESYASAVFMVQNRETYEEIWAS